MERIHRGPLIAQEVIDFRQHQARNVAGAGPIDGESKALMVRRPFDKLVEQRH